MEEPDRSPIQSKSSAARNSGAVRYGFGPTMRYFFGNSITLELPNEIPAILTKLMNQTDRDAEQLFIRAILLYKFAIDAQEAGKTIAILDSDGEIDQEITGL